MLVVRAIPSIVSAFTNTGITAPVFKLKGRCPNTMIAILISNLQWRLGIDRDILPLRIELMAPE
jgi:hypothetical protein